MGGIAPSGRELAACRREARSLSVRRRTMRFISTKVHAMMDYISGILLVAVPMMWLDEGGPAVWVPMAVGVVILIKSMFTDYELSLADLIPVPAHLSLD